METLQILLAVLLILALCAGSSLIAIALRMQKEIMGRADTALNEAKTVQESAIEAVSKLKLAHNNIVDSQHDLKTKLEDLKTEVNLSKRPR